MPPPVGLTWHTLQSRLHLRSLISGLDQPEGSMWQVSQAWTERTA